MRFRYFMFITVILYLIITPAKSFAKTFAYFVGTEGEITKLDTETNAVAQLTLKTPSNAMFDGILGVDTVNDYIYARHCARLTLCKLGIYKLKTLEFVKEISLASFSSDSLKDNFDPEIKIAIYPDGSKFLVQYLIPSSLDRKGGYTTDLYDGKTLALIKNLPTIFGMKRVMFSADSKKIYSIIDGTFARLETIDSTTFEILGSQDLTQVWRKDVFAARSEDFTNSKILISESLKTTYEQPNKLDFYVYDTETLGKSLKISSGMQGNLRLTPDGLVIVLDENETMRDESDMVLGFKSLGRLHIYNVGTAQKLGLISFQPQGKGNIRGINQSGDKLYYQSEGTSEGTTKITVVDIKNYSIITTINLPFNVLSMIFFEE